MPYQDTEDDAELAAALAFFLVSSNASQSLQDEEDEVVECESLRAWIVFGL